jgi:hypothetical protein
MKLNKILETVTDKNKFANLQAYITFCNDYLNFINDNLQAVIISQNEHKYQFFQYGKDGKFQVTRPINSDLMYQSDSFSSASAEFLYALRNIKTINRKDKETGKLLNNATYTIQQSVGAALDALPAGKANTARKLNGDLFENFIRLIINETGIKCRSGVVQLPVVVNGNKEFNMNYQHDLIIENQNDIKMIGSIKTSSKDRLDKIFIDKFLYNKLVEKDIPHIAIFLNDVQRKGKEPKFGVSSTFLPGHFKGYTVKLNPLNGVYYCDIRPNMQTDSILCDHIKTFDKLLIEDIWHYV